MMEPYNQPEINRQRTTEIMIETFDAQKFYLANQSQMSLTGSGLATGLVVESGFSSTLAVPIIDGNLVPDAVERIGLAGE